MTFQYVDRAIQRLWHVTGQKENLHVYAILDAARDEKIYPAIVESSREHRCLYAGHQVLFLGKLPQVLAKAAPHLVKLEPEAVFTRWIISRGWGDSWGIFLVSSADLRELLRHFRRFLMVKDENGKAFYFRYYDPRVMRVYLPTCNVTELKMLFGPVDRYYVEDEDAGSLREYRLVDSKLAERKIQVYPPDQNAVEAGHDSGKSP